MSCSEIVKEEPELKEELAVTPQFVEVTPKQPDQTLEKRLKEEADQQKIAEILERHKTEDFGWFNW